VGGWVKSGFKAFGDYFVVGRRQKEEEDCYSLDQVPTTSHVVKTES
jgi:hypothetical protein